MINKNFFLVLGLIALFLILDILFNPLVSFSLFFCTFLYLNNRNPDYLFVFTICQILEDFLFLRVVGLSLVVWWSAFFIIDYLNEKYYPTDNQVIKSIILVIFYTFISGFIDLFLLGLNQGFYFYYLLLIFKDVLTVFLIMTILILLVQYLAVKFSRNQIQLKR